MLPVALDRPRWWSVRWASRLFTGLAVAVALALSGGPLAGSLPVVDLSALAASFPVERPTDPRVTTSVPRTVTGGTAAGTGWTARVTPGPAAPVTGPATVTPDRSAAVTGGAARLAGQVVADADGSGAGPGQVVRVDVGATGPVGGVAVPVGASTSTGAFPPAASSAGTDTDTVGSRAPPGR